MVAAAPARERTVDVDLYLGSGYTILDRKALLELETRARRTGRETSDCNSRARLGSCILYNLIHQYMMTNQDTGKTYTGGYPTKP